MQLQKNVVSKKELSLAHWEGCALREEGRERAYGIFLPRKVGIFHVEPSYTELSTLTGIDTSNKASYAGGSTWGKEPLVSEHFWGWLKLTALTGAVAAADRTFVSVFLFILRGTDANRLISAGKAQGLAFEIINRNCPAIFSLFLSTFLFVSKFPFW